MGQIIRSNKKTKKNRQLKTNEFLSMWRRCVFGEMCDWTMHKVYTLNRSLFIPLRYSKLWVGNIDIDIFFHSQFYWCINKFCLYNLPTGHKYKWLNKPFVGQRQCGHWEFAADANHAQTCENSRACADMHLTRLTLRSN